MLVIVLGALFLLRQDQAAKALGGKVPEGWPVAALAQLAVALLVALALQLPFRLVQAGSLQGEPPWDRAPVA